MDFAKILTIVTKCAERNTPVIVYSGPGRGTWSTLQETLTGTGRPVIDLRLYAVHDDSAFAIPEDSNAILFVSEFYGNPTAKTRLLEFLRNKPKNVSVVCVKVHSEDDLGAPLANRLIHLRRDN